MEKNPICLIGATGFVGRHLVHRLVRSGRSCRLLARRPERHRDLRLLNDVEVRGVDPFDRTALTEQLGGCAALVNLVGILNEGGADTFERVHVELVGHLVAAAQAAGVGRLLQVSALNADATQGASRYLRSKGTGEDLAHAQGGPTLGVTSFQPALVFGRGDHLFNRFASLLRVSPGVFPLACPQARVAPVYVGDLVAAMSAALDDPATHGRRFQLCGPRSFTLKELVEYTAATIGRRTRVIGLDERLSRLQAQLFERLPGKPFTLDNCLSLQTASVCSEDGLAALGVPATDIQAVVPEYLAARRP